MRPLLVALALAFTLVTGPAAPGADPAVGTTDLDLDTPDGPLALRVTWPATATGACPVVIWSHGLGGSHEGYGFLAEPWAAAGLVVIRPDHRGSDTDALRQVIRHPGAVRESIADLKSPGNARQRLVDVATVADHLPAIAAGLPGFHGTLDGGRLGLGGHSFGAWTALVGSGREATGAASLDALATPRFRAVLACSPPGPGGASRAGGATPATLVLTGTRDTVPKFLDPQGQGGDWHRRVDTFNLLAGGERHLAVLTDARHCTFSNGAGNVLTGEPMPEPWMVQATVAITTSWWRGQLAGDAAEQARFAAPTPFPAWPAAQIAWQ